MTFIFAEASNPESGIGAFHINLKSFIFQMITFLIVLLIFRRWILPPILSTLDSRKSTLEKSLAQAKETEEVLQKAGIRSEEILAKARAQADAALADAKAAARTAISDAEKTAAKRSALIIKEAEERLDLERQKLRTELRGELADLVADATEKLIHEKLDAKRDMNLIERAIKGFSQ